MEWAWSLENGLSFENSDMVVGEGSFLHCSVRLFSFHPVIHLDEGFSGVDP